MNQQRQIKKHVAGIHCSNNMSLLERRTFNALLFHAQSGDSFGEDFVFFITLSKLKEFLRFQSRNNKAIKEAIIGLTETTLRWNLCNDKAACGAHWFSASLLASASYSGGVIRYEYSKAIRDLVKDPSVYANICLDAQASLRSKYSLALYENCIRYKSIGSTRVFPISLLRELLGADFGSYKKGGVLCQKIIKPAIDEINNKTSLKLRSHFIKRGNEIEAVKISVQSGTKKTIQTEGKDCDRVFKTLQSLPPAVVSGLETSFLEKGSAYHKKYTLKILKTGGGFKNPILLDPSSGGGILFLEKVHPELFKKLCR